LKKIDQVPPSKLDENVSEVINYPNRTESVNIISFSAIAIYFSQIEQTMISNTPQTFSYISSLLLSEKRIKLKQKISEMTISYIVITPNKKE
jgi:hypothetical protein